MTNKLPSIRKIKEYNNNETEDWFSSRKDCKNIQINELKSFRRKII